MMEINFVQPDSDPEKHKMQMLLSAIITLLLEKNVITQSELDGIVEDTSNAVKEKKVVKKKPKKFKPPEKTKKIKAQTI